MKPERSCFVCRKKSEKETLLRFVTIEDPLKIVIKADPEQRGAGRGIYAHRTAACLLSKRFFEAFRGARRKVRRETVAHETPKPIELFGRTSGSVANNENVRNDSGLAVLRSLEDVLEESDGDSQWTMRAGRRARIWTEFRECVFRLRTSIEQTREPKNKRSIRL